MNARRLIGGLACLLAGAATAEFFDREHHLTYFWYEIEVIVFDRPVPDHVPHEQTHSKEEPHYAPKHRVDDFRLPRQAISFFLSDEDIRRRLHGMTARELSYPVIDIPTTFPDWLWRDDDFARLRRAAQPPEPIEMILPGMEETGMEQTGQDDAPSSTGPGETSSPYFPGLFDSLPDPVAPLESLPTVASPNQPRAEEEPLGEDELLAERELLGEEKPLTEGETLAEQEPPVERAPTDEEMLAEAVALFEEELMAKRLRPSDKMVRLAGTWRAMNRRYGVLRAWRWLQNAPARETPEPVVIGVELDDGGFLAGSMAITVGRFLHFHVRMARFNAGGSAGIIDQGRRLQSAQVHYFDNPAFGIMVRIDHVPIPKELELLAERVAIFAEPAQ